MGAGFSEMIKNMDKYRDMRLNIDNMTYEQLLELGDKIGYVSTGLQEDAMASCLMRSWKRKPGPNQKCTICQEEYKSTGEDTGKIRNCGHLYHTDCIKQWLTKKNTCPICKTPVALPQYST